MGRVQFIVSWWGSWRERDRWGVLDVDVLIILGWFCGGRTVYRALCGNRRERDHWGDLGVDG